MIYIPVAILVLVPRGILFDPSSREKKIDSIVQVVGRTIYFQSFWNEGGIKEEREQVQRGLIVAKREKSEKLTCLP